MKEGVIGEEVEKEGAIGEEVEKEGVIGEEVEEEAHARLLLTNMFTCTYMT